MRRPTQKQLQDRCDDWNQKYPVGTKVEYHPVIRRPDHSITETTERAFVLSGHTACVFVRNQSGCVALDAVVPVAGETVDA